MKSTGECLGIAKTFNEALYKAFLGAGINLPKHKNMIITVRDEDQEEIVDVARRFEKLGYRIFATRNTAKVLQGARRQCMSAPTRLNSASPNLLDLILGHEIDLVIDTPSQGTEHAKDGFLIRRTCHRDWSQCTDRHGYRKSSGDQSGKHRHQEADIGRHCYRKKSGSEVKKYQGKRLKSCSCLHDKAFHLGTKLEESCRRAAFFCSDQRKCDKNVKKVDIIVSK